MQTRRTRNIFVGSLLLIGCTLLNSCTRLDPTDRKVYVAAAANLTEVFHELGQEFQAKTGIEVVISYASTAELAQQIDNGAPFDVFASADAQHVDSLVAKGKLDAASRAVYAFGQLALWVPKPDDSGIVELKDLAAKRVRFVAVAQPELAPYGRAAVETLKSAKLWETVEPKVVYGNSVNMARQMASTGSADAAFTAYSLVLHQPGTAVRIDSRMYGIIEQALAVVSSSQHLSGARQFREFVLSQEGRLQLVRGGYLVPEPGSLITK
ncbi:MAG: molybdate ABC transporter substrate-binding protein [Acidobacteriota bacterium]